jgi:protein-tyrosine phosphatase
MDGRALRRGAYFRADNLGKLTSEGEDAVVALGVDTVIDLRTAREITVRPNPLATDARVAYHSRDLVGDSHEIISKGDTIVSTRSEERNPDGTFVDPVGRLVLIYTTMLDHQQETMRSVFHLLARDRSDGAVLFHCVAGQDRTGIVAAFLLAIAGVDAQTIVFDYAATAHYNIRRYREENARVYWEMALETAEQYGAQFCPAGAMEGMLTHLDEAYGGPVAYLRTIGVGDAELALIRKRLLD